MSRYEFKWHTYLKYKYCIYTIHKDNAGGVGSQYCRWGRRVISFACVDDKIVILCKVSLRKRIKTAIAAWKQQRERRRLNNGNIQRD